MPVRFPEIKIVMSEGGIGWVPALLDRLDHMETYSSMYGTWAGIKESLRLRCCVAISTSAPSRIPTAFTLRERIGVDHILLEEDYPHSDSLWPRTQQVVDKAVGWLPPDDIRKITWENAVEALPAPGAAERDRRPGVVLTGSRGCR